MQAHALQKDVCICLGQAHTGASPTHQWFVNAGNLQ
jgi:hypothetical protein